MTGDDDVSATEPLHDELVPDFGLRVQRIAAGLLTIAVVLCVVVLVVTW